MAWPILYPPYDVPPHRAGLGVEGNQMRIDGTHEYQVAQQGNAAIHLPATEPNVLWNGSAKGPHRPPAARVQRYNVTRRLGYIHEAIDYQRRRLGFVEHIELVHP